MPDVASKCTSITSNTKPLQSSLPGRRKGRKQFGAERLHEQYRVKWGVEAQWGEPAHRLPQPTGERHSRTGKVTLRLLFQRQGICDSQTQPRQPADPNSPCAHVRAIRLANSLELQHRAAVQFLICHTKTGWVCLHCTW